MAEVIMPHKAAAITDFCIEGLIKGYSTDDLVQKVIEQYHVQDVDEIRTLIRKGLNRIKDETLVDIDRIIPQHVELYEWLYQQYDGLRSVTGKVKAMRAKEKLIGLHKENNYVDIYNEMNIEIEMEGGGYNLNALSQQEKDRLQVLLQKIEK